MAKRTVYEVKSKSKRPKLTKKAWGLAGFRQRAGQFQPIILIDGKEHDMPFMAQKHAFPLMKLLREFEVSFLMSGSVKKGMSAKIMTMMSALAQ